MTTAPQDHQAPKSEIDAKKQLTFNEVEGSELLVPFKRLKASDAMRLTGRLLRTLGDEVLDNNGKIDANDLKAAVSALNWDEAADFIDFIGERYVADPEGWAEFNRFDNMDAVLDLVFAYAGEMGKDKN